MDKRQVDWKAGELGVRDVIHPGQDRRNVVTTTSQYPWRALCALCVETTGHKKRIGTGWFVNERTLLTAAHVLAPLPPDEPALLVRVIPGLNGTNKPFGYADTSSFRISGGWKTSPGPETDFAAVVLPNDDLGKECGSFFLPAMQASDVELGKLAVTVAGYPTSDGEFPGELLVQSDQIVQVDPLRVYYEVDTTPGESGAPVWKRGSTPPEVVAIHGYGIDGLPPEYAGKSWNSGLRITAGVYEELKAWLDLTT